MSNTLHLKLFKECETVEPADQGDSLFMKSLNKQLAPPQQLGLSVFSCPFVHCQAT